MEQDNDDGSSWYISRGNFFVYGGGGLKNDFEGTDNHWIGNVIAFTDGALLHNGYGGQIGQVCLLLLYLISSVL